MQGSVIAFYAWRDMSRKASKFRNHMGAKFFQKGTQMLTTVLKAFKENHHFRKVTRRAMWYWGKQSIAKAFNGWRDWIQETKVCRMKVVPCRLSCSQHKLLPHI